jgi:uncharacterized protein YbbC (DUF1343 family)
VVEDADLLEPVRVGVALALSLRALYPAAWRRANLGTLLGSEATLRAIERGEPLGSIAAGWAPGRERFLEERARFLLY